MRPGTFCTLVAIGALMISGAIYGALLSDYIKVDGALVIVLMAFPIMAIAFSVQSRLARPKMPGMGTLMGLRLESYRTFNDDLFDEAVLQAYLKARSDKTVADMWLALGAHGETRDNLQVSAR